MFLSKLIMIWFAKVTDTWPLSNKQELCLCGKAHILRSTPFLCLVECTLVSIYYLAHICQTTIKLLCLYVTLSRARPNKTCTDRFFQGITSRLPKSLWFTASLLLLLFTTVKVLAMWINMCQWLSTRSLLWILTLSQQYVWTGKETTKYVS